MTSRQTCRQATSWRCQSPLWRHCCAASESQAGDCLIGWSRSGPGSLLLWEVQQSGWALSKAILVSLEIHRKQLVIKRLQNSELRQKQSHEKKPPSVVTPKIQLFLKIVEWHSFRDQLDKLEEYGKPKALFRLKDLKSKHSHPSLAA